MLIQVEKLDGSDIENASWVTNKNVVFDKNSFFFLTLDLNEENSLKIKNYISKTRVSGIALIGEEINLRTIMDSVNHMYSIKNNEIEMILNLKPINKSVEQIICYLCSPNQCDSTFLKHLDSKNSIENL